MNLNYRNWKLKDQIHTKVKIQVINYSPFISMATSYFKKWAATSMNNSVQSLSLSMTVTKWSLQKERGIVFYWIFSDNFIFCFLTSPWPCIFGNLSLLDCFWMLARGNCIKINCVFFQLLPYCDGILWLPYKITFIFVFVGGDIQASEQQ